MVMNRRMDEHVLVRLYSATPHWKLTEKNPAKHNMDSHRQHAEQKRPDMEVYILYGSISVRSETTDNQSTMTEVRRVEILMLQGSC